jgi:hypothetical protein
MTERRMRLPRRYLLRLATAVVLGEEKRRGERGARGYAETAAVKRRMKRLSLANGPFPLFCKF